jgi:exopolyphosphatase/guanosine-5'-triphosphate,3'-diphosphate pyrophosphatase
VGNLLSNPVLKRFSGAWKASDSTGALTNAKSVQMASSQRPLAIVDIGSNSVRLVAYEGLSRAPNQIFNEKMLCGLGNGVTTTGKLPKGGMEKALTALRRFRVLIDLMNAADVYVIATAAARDASNGPDFLKAAEEAIGTTIALLSGEREAQLSALGVISGTYRPNGIVGDLGGGSLELIDVKGGSLGKGATLPLGGLALMDASERSPRAAVKIVRDALSQSKILDKLEGRCFYAVGGTWRALAKLHMRQRNYPLPVMHGYLIPAQDAEAFAGLVERVNTDALNSISSINSARRPLLAYGAVVLEEIIKLAHPKEIMISTAGVREGLIYEKLDEIQRGLDPLLVTANELNDLLSRAPQAGQELCAWTDEFMKSTHLEETSEERRLRHAASLLTDVNWRAHPDYRGEQSLNMVANASFMGIDHSARAFLALATSYRHLSADEDISPQLRSLVSARMLDRARIFGACARVAFIVAAAMPGVLPRTPLICQKSKLTLSLPADLADLAGDRLMNRVKHLARQLGRDPAIEIAI